VQRLGYSSGTSNIAVTFLPQLVETLVKDEDIREIIGNPFSSYVKKEGLINWPISVSPAGPNDFDTEWLSLILGLKVVSSIDEAIEHIQVHSTNHSDGILTQNEANAKRSSLK